MDGPGPGAWNMAVDEAILSEVTVGSSLPTIRFYEWAPPCLSLGRSQSEGEANGQACRDAGVHCVRRPTGGRAILHRDELTYSICLPVGDPRAAGDVLESYRRLSEGLTEGLGLLGLAVDRTRQRETGGHPISAACFDAPAGYEVTIGDRKLLGSAQFRARGALLQHGSLPLSGDIAGVVDFLTLEDVARETLRTRLHSTAITVETAAGHRVSFAEAVDALCEGISRALNVQLSEGRLSFQELRQGQLLASNKYASPGWTRIQRPEPIAGKAEASQGSSAQ